MCARGVAVVLELRRDASREAAAEVDLVDAGVDQNLARRNIHLTKQLEDLLVILRRSLDHEGVAERVWNYARRLGIISGIHSVRQRLARKVRSGRAGRGSVGTGRRLRDRRGRGEGAAISAAAVPAIAAIAAVPTVPAIAHA